jgi:dTDP-4-amino-4,6-dideoxygalactose transaminase
MNQFNKAAGLSAEVLAFGCRGPTISPIPIMRPLLPSRHRLAAYLREIDDSRIYTNFGPLAVSLHQRIAAHFGLSVGTVTTVANGTLGLAVALSVQDARPGTLCILPAWTFIASAHAAIMAGLTPYFVDVDPHSWAIDPDTIADVISRAPGQVGAVMPVVPLGQPIDIAAWDTFRTRTRLPVVIDAAAGFDSLSPGDCPVVVSLHATKVLGAGEGGFIISRDPSLIRFIRAKSNYGFLNTREAIFAATNAKLSEYHAAIAHAALDEWKDVRTQWMAAASAYRQHLCQSNRVRFQDRFGESWISSTCVLHFTESAAPTETALSNAAIMTRRWWGDGAHAHAATQAFPRTALPVTEELAKNAISIPFFRDIADEDIRRVSEIILATIE